MQSTADRSPAILLLGANYPILEKIGCAKSLCNVYGAELLSHKAIKDLLETYREDIRQTWIQMDKAGVIAECTDCAINDRGSCCGTGIEDRFDAILLLINLMMGCELPLSPWDKTGCWFLGEEGCLIVARHVICVNYMCKRLTNLETNAIRLLQEKIGLELETGFVLEEGIKTWLRNKGL